MAGVCALVSYLLSSITKLLPEVKNPFFAPSSSSSAESPDPLAVKDDLEKLMRTLEWVKAALYDAEERQIRDSSVKHWLKELKEVAHEAGYVIDEYMYEVYRAKVEPGNASEVNTHKRKHEGRVSAPCSHTVIPDELVHHISRIRSRFDEIAKGREDFRLNDEDGWKSIEHEGCQAPSSYSETNVFGRNREKEKVLDLLFSNMKKSIITVVPIVGKGGIGKTTLGKLVYNDEQVNQNFDLFGWICVSKNFSVGRIMQELIESFTPNNCSLKNPSALHMKLQNIVMGKKVFVVLDDLWNEDIDLWESLHAPFNSALRAALIVTTRSERVANITKTIPSPFQPGCLSEEDSWSLFQHYSGMNPNFHINKELGEKITKKCGGFPLALKSISKIFRYGNEETWTENLENDLSEISAENDIFKALQISYTYMPTYLKQCFLYCSMFPKDYEYEVEEIIELWIAQGYIECKGTKTLEEVAFDYIRELREMSFIDPIYKGTLRSFKLHDMFHDLARLNSGYSIEIVKQPNPDGILHLYVDDCNEPWDDIYLENITRLVTLILKVEFGSNFIDLESNSIDLSKAKGLKILKLQYSNLEKNVSLPTFVFPKHLRFLDLAYDISGSLSVPIPLSSLYHLERLKLNLRNSRVELEELGNLINLQSLTISHCTITKLPKTIGNLVQLQRLVINGCEGLFPDSICELPGLKTLSLTKCPAFKMLPENMAKLTNLKSLIVKNTGIHYLPHSFNILCILSQLDFQISLSFGVIYDQISWFKNLYNLKGTLAIQLLRHTRDIKQVCNFNLINKPYLEKLILSWGAVASGHWDKKCVLEITMETDKNYTQKTKSASQLLSEDMDSLILENLQPHRKLKHIEIWYYKGCTFPGWMTCSSCELSLEALHLRDCLEITDLPFANLRSLKHLKVFSCDSIQHISRESLPSKLQSLVILQCSSLLTITGLADLEFLVRVEIQHCNKLASFPFELISEGRCHKSSSNGLENLSPLKKLKISYCPELQLSGDEVLPSVQCNIEISACKGLKEWCLQHKISINQSNCT